MQKAWKADIDHRSRSYSGIEPDEFKVGARVLVFTPSRKKGTSDKLTSAWTGPFLLADKYSPILYRLKQDPSNMEAGRPPKGIVALSRLKLVVGGEKAAAAASDGDSEPYFPHEYEALCDIGDDEAESEGEEV